MNMKKPLPLFMSCLIFIALIVLSGCSGIRSLENSRFTIEVAGPPGAEFEGFCTHEVKYIYGSRTEETSIQGKIMADKKTFEFVIPGGEISCKITNKTPEKPITVILRKDGAEVKRVEGLEYDWYLSYFPPQIVDTAAKAAQGIRYVPSEHAGTVNEIVEFTEAEKTKIADLIEKLPQEVKQQFDVKYEAWKATWTDPVIMIQSDPRAFARSGPYKQLLQFCREQGAAVWPLIFERLNIDRVFIAANLLEDLTLDKYSNLLDTIREDSQHERYTGKGDYIAPSQEANVMKYAKELLALL